MPENSKISAKLKRVLLFSIFIIPTVLCFAFYIFMIRKPFLENPAGLYKRLNYFGTKQLASNGKDTIYTQLPDFLFINQDQKRITPAEFKGKITVVALICTSCTTSCPKISAQFFRMQKQLNYLKAFKIVALSVNPELDSIQNLKRYSRMVHANPDFWSIASGSRNDLLRFASSGLEIIPANSKEIAHQSKLYLIDKDLHIRGIYDGTSISDVDRLIDEIKVLDAEYRVNKRLKGA